MNILIVTQYFWPEQFRINDVATALRKKGHAVTILTGLPNYPEGKYYSGYGFTFRREEDYKGIKVVRVPLIPRGSGKPFRLVANYFSFMFFATLLAPFYLRDSFDVQLVYQTSPVTVGLPAVLIKRLKRVPILFWIQDLWPESLEATGAVKNSSILALVDKFVKFLYRKSDMILVQSRGMISSVRSKGIPGKKVRYLPNSAEDLYRPNPKIQNSEEYSTLPTGFRVVFAGNIGEAQDFGTILSAAELLNHNTDINWVVIGDGRRRGWVEEEVQKRGLADSVYLLGRHPVESMPGFFSLADALLVTLKKERIFALTIPSKLQSYLASAKPIIAGLDGEGASIVEEADAGLTCPAESPEQLAEIVLEMYHLSDNERSSMGQRGREYFEKEFEGNVLLDKLEKIMEEVVSGGSQ